MKLWIFDPTDMVLYPQIPFEVNKSKSHDELALKMVQKSMTLLKINGILPLNKKKVKKIAVFGSNANNIDVLRGSYYGTTSNPITVINGIKNIVGTDVEVTFSKGVSEVANEKTVDSTLSKVTLEEVRNGGVAIFVGGLDAIWKGEEMVDRNGVGGFLGGDRTKTELPKIQMDALKAMKETGTPIVFVLMAGSTIAFDGFDKELEAILMARYPGQRGGDAIADVLFGDYNPAGRLSVTFYASTDELPDFKDYNMRAGKGFTFRYYNGAALCPFGHGLSYTNFKYSNLQIDKTKLRCTDAFTISVNIRNNGAFDGEEVLQLYIKDIESDTWMAKKQLRKFERIALKKVESKTITFNLEAREDPRYYDAMYLKYMVESGSFEIQIGASSEDIRLKDIISIEE
jgi:beta-glucosidase